MTRSYKIPEDLDRLEAAGLAAPAPWTRKTIERLLARVELCIEAECVPGLMGRRCREAERKTGKSGWHEGVPWPDELAYEREDVRKAMAACHEAIAAGDIERAGGHADSLETILDLVQGRADPEKAEGRAQRERRRRGGNKTNPETAEILAYIEAGHSYGQAAQKFGKSKNAIAQIVQYHRKKGIDN